jgi:hypothetical protein
LNSNEWEDFRGHVDDWPGARNAAVAVIEILAVNDSRRLTAVRCGAPYRALKIQI